MSWKPNAKHQEILVGDDRVYLSYTDNASLLKEILGDKFQKSPFHLDSENPETAIVIKDDIELTEEQQKYFPNGMKRRHRFLILTGDHRKELEKLYPDIEKLTQYWIKHSDEHHFFTDVTEKYEESGS